MRASLRLSAYFEADTGFRCPFFGISGAGWGSLRWRILQKILDIALLNEGKIVEYGSPKEICRRPVLLGL